MMDTQDRLAGSLLGVLVGDALGLPWEMMTAEEILAATNGKGVHGFDCAKNARRVIEQGLVIGSPSDDWQLTAAGMDSIVECRGYRTVNVAQKYVRAYETSTFGWGGTTKAGVLDMKKFFDSGGTEGRHPVVPAREMEKVNSGCGNGVAMRIAPVALWHVASGRYGTERRKPGDIDVKLFADVMTNGFMTHPDPRASFAAYAVAIVIAEVLREPITLGNMFERTAEIWRTVFDGVYFAETFYADFRWKEDTFSARLRAVAENVVLDDPVALRKLTGTGCNSLESIPFSIATALRNPLSPRTAILEAVKAGGDTDSNAAIVGSIVGANCGPEEMLGGFRKFVPWLDPLLYAGELCDITNGDSRQRR